MKQLHEMLLAHGKIFLRGIAGVGKSELVKAYAKQYKKEYTNILYIIYSGDLRQDVIDLDFADDLPGESEEERFRKHNHFLRSLKSDTLLIVDNFNVTVTSDGARSFRCSYSPHKVNDFVGTPKAVVSHPTVGSVRFPQKRKDFDCMAICHLEAKVVSHGNGRSACAASAYMSCGQIYNDYDGMQHDYTRKQGLVWQRAFLLENAQSERQDREKLWNAVEANEKTKDSPLPVNL